MDSCYKYIIKSDFNHVPFEFTMNSFLVVITAIMFCARFVAALRWQHLRYNSAAICGQKRTESSANTKSVRYTLKTADELLINFKELYNANPAFAEMFLKVSIYFLSLLYPLKHYYTLNLGSIQLLSGHYSRKRCRSEAHQGYSEENRGNREANQGNREANQGNRSS